MDGSGKLRVKGHLILTIPGDDFDKVGIQGNTSLRIKNARASVADKVVADNLVVGVAQDSLELALRSGLHDSLDFFVSGTFFETAGQVDNRDIRRGDTEGHTAGKGVSADSHFFFFFFPFR